MSKAITIPTLCMVAILLLSMLLCAMSCPLPTFNDVTPVEPHRIVEEVAKVNAVENCTGPREEDCLMRRTLVDHLDYIYTNKNGNL
ncbi:hypothetical protein L1987_31924 [Smallanthus sonchifolius]|uniref:Uncharacterized protein n=1 Tax=Smallanthus sonchifolius TaxID=185202 RepID=A0ACB9I7I6_9ASTR|nr:hypothetical protein L1987_31924 [Smallanthus sonchifolius]